MIMPYLPTPDRVELLHVRRVDPILPADDSRLSLLRDPGDVVVHLPARMDRVEISDDARCLLEDDVGVQAG